MENWTGNIIRKPSESRRNQEIIRSHEKSSEFIRNHQKSSTTVASLFFRLSFLLPEGDLRPVWGTLFIAQSHEGGGDCPVRFMTRFTCENTQIDWTTAKSHLLAAGFMFQPPRLLARPSTKLCVIYVSTNHDRKALRISRCHRFGLVSGFHWGWWNPSCTDLSCGWIPGRNDLARGRGWGCGQELFTMLCAPDDLDWRNGIHGRGLCSSVLCWETTWEY